MALSYSYQSQIEKCACAIKYATCAQNVSDVTHSFYTFGCWPTADEGSSALKYATCAQNVSDRPDRQMKVSEIGGRPDNGQKLYLAIGTLSINGAGWPTGRILFFGDRQFGQVGVAWVWLRWGPGWGRDGLEHRACAQNVSDVSHSFHISGCWPTSREGVTCSGVPCLRTECVRR